MAKGAVKKASPKKAASPKKDSGEKSAGDTVAKYVGQGVDAVINGVDTLTKPLRAKVS